MAFLTGAFGPTRRYPEFLRAIGDVLPLKYFVDIVNAIYLRDRAIWTKPLALWVLAAWGTAGLLVAVFHFRWEPREGSIPAAMDPAIAICVRQHEDPALEVRVNFGVFAGRDVTPAEIDDLARELHNYVDSFSVVAEARHEFAGDVEASLHQVVIEVER